MSATCAIECCSRPASSRGVCKTHYGRAWRWRKLAEDPSYQELRNDQSRALRAKDRAKSRAQSLARYYANHEKSLAYAAKSRAKHRDAKNGRRRARHVYDPGKWKKSLSYKYGITIEDYELMLAAQGGVCAICHQPETSAQAGRIRRLAVDHNHETGAVRGLLCSACNTAAGVVENEAFVAAIRAYLEQPTVKVRS